MTHVLKCWPDFFRETCDGEKSFEVRKYDRDYNVGDILELLEYNPTLKHLPEARRYTGRKCRVEVTFIMIAGESDPFDILKPGTCVMGIRLV